MNLETYKPGSLRELLGNQRAAEQVRQWASAWRRGAPPLIVSGPTGTGKSLVLGLVASEFKWEIVEGQLADVESASRQASIWMRGKLLVVDIDWGAKRGDVMRLAESTRWPLCLVTEDIYDQRLYDIRKAGWPVARFFKVGWQGIARLLKRVAAEKGIPHDDKALYGLAQAADGDVRWALLTLASLAEVRGESVAQVAKDRVEKLFEMLDGIFGGRAAGVEDAASLLPWVTENLPERYRDAQLLAASRCVQLSQRTAARNLGGYPEDFLRLMPPSHVRAQYRPPSRVRASLRPEIVEIAGRAHCSRKKAVAYLPLVKAATK